MSFAISSRTMSEIRNRRARTGRQDVPIQDLIEADLSAQYGHSLESARLGQQIKQDEINNDIRREELDAQKSAAMVSGVAQLGSTAATGYMAYKYFAPAVTGATTGGTTALATGTTGGTMATAINGYTPSYAAGAGATTTGGGIGSAISSYALPAAAVVAGYSGWKGMHDAQKGTGGGVGSKIATKITPWNDAGTTGAVMNIVTAPLTALAGAVDMVGELFGGTIICMELYRQGYLTKFDVARCRMYREKHISQDKYEEYLEWATPVVKLMQNSQMATAIMAPIWKAWARAMMAKVDKKVKASRFDNWILNMTHRYTDYRINRRKHGKLFGSNRPLERAQ